MGCVASAPDERDAAPRKRPSKKTSSAIDVTSSKEKEPAAQQTTIKLILLGSFLGIFTAIEMKFSFSMGTSDAGRSERS